MFRTICEDKNFNHSALARAIENNNLDELNENNQITKNIFIQYIQRESSFGYDNDEIAEEIVNVMYGICAAPENADMVYDLVNRILEELPKEEVIRIETDQVAIINLETKPPHGTVSTYEGQKDFKTSSFMTPRLDSCMAVYIKSDDRIFLLHVSPTQASNHSPSTVPPYDQLNHKDLKGKKIEVKIFGHIENFYEGIFLRKIKEFGIEVSSLDTIQSYEGQDKKDYFNIKFDLAAQKVWLINHHTPLANYFHELGTKPLENVSTTAIPAEMPKLTAEKEHEMKPLGNLEKNINPIPTSIQNNSIFRSTTGRPKPEETKQENLVSSNSTDKLVGSEFNQRG